MVKYAVTIVTLFSITLCGCHTQANPIQKMDYLVLTETSGHDQIRVLIAQDGAVVDLLQGKLRQSFYCPILAKEAVELHRVVYAMADNVSAKPPAAGTPRWHIEAHVNGKSISCDIFSDINEPYLFVWSAVCKEIKQMGMVTLAEAAWAHHRAERLVAQGDVKGAVEVYEEAVTECFQWREELSGRYGGIYEPSVKIPKDATPLSFLQEKWRIFSGGLTFTELSSDELMVTLPMVVTKSRIKVPNGGISPGVLQVLRTVAGHD
jgi:hypothetical protein